MDTSPQHPASSTTALRLAGFALAHAAWSVADAPHADLLVPFVLARCDGQQELMPFEAETQDEAIAEARRAVAHFARGDDAWAFAREGTLRTAAGSAQDVLVVEFAGGGGEPPHLLIQPYARLTETTPFALVGEPMVMFAGEVLDPEATRRVRAGVERGVAEHAAAAPLWRGWRRDAPPAPAEEQALR